MFVKRLLAILLSAYCTASIADDTELFFTDDSSTSAKPQVLIIFDNSGSMATEETVVSTPYDSSDYDAATDASKIFWSSDSVVPGPDSGQYFYVSENNCNASLYSLANTGYYTGNVRRWYSSNKTRDSEWKTLSGTVGDIYDCKDDYSNQDTANPGTGDTDGEGYPADGNNGPYSDTLTNIFDGNDAVTLYSESYVDYYDSVESTTMSRIEIAKVAITDLIESTPSVDFGLAVFNYNTKSTNSGGRIIDKVQPRNYDGDDTQYDNVNNILNTIDNLYAYTSTPLCETMYEAYTYYAGNAVYYGDDDATASPATDEDAKSGSDYISPFSERTCPDKGYVILMTDGEPHNDENGNDEVQALTGETDKIEDSYLPVLTEWMYNNDVDADDDNGTQNIITYTIGFGDSAVDDAGELLASAAELGGGEYYPATDSDALQSAFQETILAILSSSSSLSSPATSSNNFDGTQSLDSIYYAMFLPSSLPVWQGNIKKLTLNSSGVIVDRLGEPAIDDDGNVKEDASTYWGGDEDGDTVTQGGVSSLYDTITSRTILSNINAADATALIEPNLVNLKAFYSAEDDAALAGELGIEEDELSSTLSWLTGIDVDDSDGDGFTTDYRDDIFADPLHSQPLGITYTEGEGDDAENVVRLLVGTNAGFLHMFTDHGDTVSENWAFIPEELLETGLSVRTVTTSTEHIYGMDLSPISVKIVDGDDTQIIAIAGMRRGGDSYYALDVTDPDSPELLWTISSDSDGFEELGQSWSIPSTGTFSFKDGDDIVAVTGIVFGAGYDTYKDNCVPSTSENCDDSAGRGVYIADAQTGELIWSTGGLECADDDEHCMRDSIPSQVELLDSDGDGYTDRIYTGDTGGNVWRMDLDGTDTTAWTTRKLATLGGDAAATNRKFFSAPTIVRTYKSAATAITTGTDVSYTYLTVAYDGVLIGSGDRANPVSSTAVDNYYFSIQDTVISPTLYASGSEPDPMDVDDLYDIAGDPIGSAEDDAAELAAYAELSAAAGWKYALGGTDDGEKSLGQGVVIDGVSYFTSFEPNSEVSVACGVGDFGTGWLYAVNLHTGSSAFTDSNGDPVTKVDIGSQVPDSLVTHSGEDADGESILRLIGVGEGDEIVIIDEDGNSETINTGTIDTDSDLNPSRIYSYFKEN